MHSNFLSPIFLLLSFVSCVNCTEIKAIELSTDEKSSYKIAFGSCNSHSDESLWKNVNQIKPDLFMFLGDNIYLPEIENYDNSRIKDIYKKTYNSKSFRKLRKKSQILSIWDDHDYGYDNSDSANPIKSIAYSAFKSFWSNPNQPRELEGSIAYKKVIGDVLLLGADNRTYRRNKSTSNNPQVFGKKQLNWITSQIKNTKEKVILLAIGSQFISNNAHEESFSHYSEERKILLDEISRTSKPVIILSGDRHYAELLNIKHNGKEIWEFTSSPLTAPVKPERLMKNVDSSSIVLYAESNNFGVLDIILDSKISVTASLFDSRGQIQFRREIF